MKIEINDLTKVIGGQHVLNHVTMTMVSGNVYGLQGINGSGKTMLMRAVIGLMRPTEGTIHIDGRLLGKDMEFPESLGFLLENPTFLDRYSGKANLQLLADIRKIVGDERIREVILQVGLNPDDKKKYKKYSLGMKQRLGIAAAVLEQPELVILDEPANALDASGVDMLRQLMQEEKERGALVIVSCHDRSMLEDMSDVIFRMDSGSIVERVVLKKAVDADEKR